jgi:outer membrane protein assembly factor BamE (lipoprotein component of BamABCDE complex)
MKKSNFFLLLFVVLAFVSLESCSVQKSVTAKSMDIYGSGVMHKPVIADLDVSSTKKGFLPTRMTSAQRNAISNLTA